jgi:alpha-N-arabinofuranosidase
MVLLAMRPYDGYFYNLGRETFLAPVKWEEGWPVVSPGYGKVLTEYPSPNLPEHSWLSVPACDHFEDNQLAFKWNFLRTPRDIFWSLSEKPGYLRLWLRPEKISELSNPSFIGCRQQHINFTARTAFEFTPQTSEDCAGVVLLQNNNFHFRLVCTKGTDGRVVKLIKRFKGNEILVNTISVKPGRLYMKVEAKGQSYSFYATTEVECWIPIAERVDGRLLSTEVAGGFVGAYIGMYASSNGKSSTNYADFDWFEYLPSTNI